MNEYQEAILDTLMVAERIGNRWEPGPLPLAVQALKNAGLTRRHEPRAALGFPLVLCAAVEGASTTIGSVDDRRLLAISLFSEVRPRKRAPRLDNERLVRANLWSIRRVPSYCDPGNASLAEIIDLHEEYLAGRPCGAATILRLSDQLEGAMAAVEDRRKEYAPQLLALSVFYFALHALRRAQKGQGAQDLACLVTRDVARLAGLVGGVAAAVPYCVELARTLGM
jgi:hypothetical protein